MLMLLESVRVVGDATPANYTIIYTKRIEMTKITFIPGTIMTVKLNSGEEIVTKILDIDPDDNDWLIIERPVSLGQTQSGFGLVPALFTVDPDAKLRLNTNSIAFFAQAEHGIKNKYIEATTGISIPQKKVILG